MFTMKIYIEAWEGDRPLLGNLDGQAALGECSNYKRTAAYRRLNVMQVSLRVTHWRVVTDAGKVLEVVHRSEVIRAARTLPNEFWPITFFRTALEALDSVPETALPARVGFHQDNGWFWVRGLQGDLPTRRSKKIEMHFEVHSKAGRPRALTRLAAEVWLKIVGDKLVGLTKDGFSIGGGQ